MSLNNCPVCETPLKESLLDWHFSCPRCAYEQSSLAPAINENTAHDNIDEAARESGLRELRFSNFRILLQAINALKPEGGRLLDVGSAHGWFLEAAMGSYDVLGVEPDEAICASSAARGLPVRNGYFPEALLEIEKFDVIVFNDVLEHIPPVIEILKSCHERLNDGGYLVVNLPSSNGLFYRVSRVFSRLGYSGFFERLWQKGLPSPHVHYFNEYNLASLLERNGFVMSSKGQLPVVSLTGLYARISFAGKMGALTKVVIYCAVAIALPVLKLLPNDIIYLIARKA
ncbi:class I SAM-dependent methyltransferase [Pseudomonas quasicaspiana]|uniref:class I SAM-dependent methyltransferase n=1 Tax=Pseudomonas quasicaspiana TaxID=2829821 RepID=UPI001E304927|nr:class I SAM-dependent methyltransferase [Pseudomonas quasicaspiana]MCD5970846.1 class I SAM-dependent methyltransferase [Pseudomonas quasicaspiana]